MTDLGLERVLEHAADPVIVTGFVQIAIAAALTAVVLGIIYARQLGFEREVVAMAVRGLVQVVAAGAVISLLLAAHLAWAAVVLAFMIVVAAYISYKRGTALPGVFGTSLASIGFGAGLTIVAMAAAGAIEMTMRDLLVIGSMVIANAMQTNSLALDRFTGEIASNRAEIEALLSVGASPDEAVTEYVSTSVYAALIPTIDGIKSLGVVKIPGLMAGMIIAGENPIYAAQYQFAIMLMLFAAGGLTVVANTVLLSRRVFTDAKQLDEAVVDAIDD